MPVPAATDAPAAASQADAQAAPMLRKKELIERIVLASGMKKKDVKPVVEATLGVLGQALSQGESLNLPPLGKIVVNRRKDRDDGEVMVARIRRGSAMVAADKEAVDGGNTPLAEAEKES
ncbi:MAG: HU family DNA-binding protein [Rhodobacteraceae bacterium]|nr:HU family DNA-binding protein [Paracoccaceae bacterium]